MTPKPWAIFAAPTAGIGWTAVTGSEADPLASFNVVAGENYGESVTLEHLCGGVVGEWSNIALADLLAVAREHLSTCDIVQSEVNDVASPTLAEAVEALRALNSAIYQANNENRPVVGAFMSETGQATSVIARYDAWKRDGR